MMRSLIAIAALVLIGQHATAFQAGQLEPLCRSDKTENKLICLQYFKGANEMLWLMSGYNESRGYPLPYCLPDTATPDISRRLWLNYLDASPKALAEETALVYNRVLKLEYPCKDES